MGTQSDTVTGSFELASRATTCRNLYVAMTRGERTNIVCVITETHDITEARDVLDQIINFDRANVPRQPKRELTKSDHQHTTAMRGPRLVPELRTAPASNSTKQSPTMPKDKTTSGKWSSESRRPKNDTDRHGVAAEPFERTIDEADSRLAQHANEKETLEQQLRTSKRHERRSIRAEISTADHELKLATVDQAEAKQQARPTTTVLANISRELRDLAKNNGESSCSTDGAAALTPSKHFNTDSTASTPGNTGPSVPT